MMPPYEHRLLVNLFTAVRAVCIAGRHLLTASVAGSDNIHLLLRRSWLCYSCRSLVNHLSRLRLKLCTTAGTHGKVTHNRITTGWTCLITLACGRTYLLLHHWAVHHTCRAGHRLCHSSTCRTYHRRLWQGFLHTCSTYNCGSWGWFCPASVVRSIATSLIGIGVITSRVLQLMSALHADTYTWIIVVSTIVTSHSIMFLVNR